jgi:hypothetical protein
VATTSATTTIYGSERRMVDHRSMLSDSRDVPGIAPLADAGGVAICESVTRPRRFCSSGRSERRQATGWRAARYRHLSSLALTTGTRSIIAADTPRHRARCQRQYGPQEHPHFMRSAVGVGEVEVSHSAITDGACR